MNAAFGMKLNGYTIQTEAAGMAQKTSFYRGPNQPFAARDGRLIRGQQQYSSAIAAELTLETLDG